MQYLYSKQTIKSSFFYLNNIIRYYSVLFIYTIISVMDINCATKKGMKCPKMAGATRLELATSCVTGMRSNQLNYAPIVKTLHWYIIFKKNTRRNIITLWISYLSAIWDILFRFSNNPQPSCE